MHTDDSELTGAQIGKVSLVVGAITLAGQCIYWLKTGNWVDVTIAVLFRDGHNGLSRWLISRKSWIGLSKIIFGLISLPLWLLMLTLWDVGSSLL